MKTKIQIMAVCLLSLVFVVSCNKYDDDLVVDETMSQKFAQENPEYQAMSTSSVTYGVTPSLGTFTPNSSSSVTLPGTSGCGSFNGGMIKAKVVAQSGSSFTVEIYPQVGTTFGGSGTAYVKATSVCGTVAGTATYTSVHTKATVTINATFAQGVTHFYPVIITSTGSRYYAEPFMVYTLPSYASTPYWNGKLLATVDGVNLYATDTDNQSLSSAYQCTEFCRRYYNSVYSLPFSGWGDATDWMDNLDTRFNKYYNNTPSALTPRVGDILCFGGGSTGDGDRPEGYGHVAIVTEVSNNRVKFAHQNGGMGGYEGQLAPIGGYVVRSGTNLTMYYAGSPTSSYVPYYIKGWIRKKP